MPRIGPVHGMPAALPVGLSPSAVPWWMTTTWTFTPCALRRSDSALIRGASSRNVSPAVAPAPTSSGVDCSSAPMTPTLTPLTLNTTDGVTHGGSLPVAVSTMFVARNGKCARCCWVLQPVDAVVELVVAVGRGVEPPGVLDVDRRHVVEQPGVRGRGPDVVATGQDEPRAGQRGELLVEHRGQERRAADRDVDVVVPDDRRRVELTVEVVEADDGDRLDRVAALEQLGQHPALALLGLGDAEDVGQRGCEVDRPRGDLALGDAGAAGEEGRPHVDGRAEVLDVRHVAVLAEEVGRGDQRARRLGVELVRRVGEHDEVARPGRDWPCRRCCRGRSGCSATRPW